jgi:antitoxin MazE
MKTKVQKWGNSLALRVPKSFAVHCGLEDGSAVDLCVREGELVVTPMPAKKHTLEELVAGITAKNRHELIEWGPPVGGEVW